VPNQLYDFLVPRLVEKGEKIEVLATGLPASPGAAVGQIVFTAEDAVKHHQNGSYKSIVLVRGETTPEDIAGMEVADGILTSRGGMTSHAAVVTRGIHDPVSEQKEKLQLVQAMRIFCQKPSRCRRIDYLHRRSRDAKLPFGIADATQGTYRHVVRTQPQPV
jgi:phosphoenolpyruvate synthase/pyruvate phosphate dikinase